jgi:hypothetical protein
VGRLERQERRANRFAPPTHSEKAAHGGHDVSASAEEAGVLST